MNLYLITQTVNNEYDTYDGFVVCAESEDDAKTIKELNKSEPYGIWVWCIDDIEVKYLGKADDSVERGEVLGSFRAG